MQTVGLGEAQNVKADVAQVRNLYLFKRKNRKIGKKRQRVALIQVIDQLQ